MFERLRDEHGFTGGYTIIKDYMREPERRGREMFVPLAHPPGHAQADFGEAVVVIGGIEQKAHSRLCPVTDPRFTYRGEDVVQTLERVCGRIGYPKTIRVDNGSESISRDLDLWAHANDVTLNFSRPGKPTDNGLVECFFNRIKRFRRIALRYGKTVSSFKAFVDLACAMAWIRRPEAA